MNLSEVLDFCRTAQASERAAILEVLTAGGGRKQRAYATLSQINAGSNVQFTYDSVQYEGMVVRINQTTATVTITKIVGAPRRSIAVGSTVRVGASLLRNANVSHPDSYPTCG